MKLIFNDATEIIVQQVESHGDYPVSYTHLDVYKRQRKYQRCG